MKIEDLKNARPGDHCLICGAPPEIIGIFKPEEPTKWGGTNGKTRLIRYCLCKKCERRPYTRDTVERIILWELGGGASNA